MTASCGQVILLVTGKTVTNRKNDYYQETRMATNTTETKKPLPAMERRQRIRQQTISSILDAARAIMREEGVPALNLNEVARRVGMRPQSLAEYFPNKAAMYDTLFATAIRLMREGDDRAKAEHPPDWGRVRAWFENRLAFAEKYPELFHLTIDMPVPGFIPSEENRQAVSELLESARRGIAEVAEAGAMDPGMPPDRAVDILLTARHGIIAEALGKGAAFPERSARFRRLIPDVIAVYQKAWTPQHMTRPTESGGEGEAGE
ncbi:MAG TPA: TetR/AcrR family transcriptional regulator [Thermomicrobiales bacterium]|nr:TetR/AcrR family transcriptional regulator [Thermomicrobiales bacterium]